MPNFKPMPIADDIWPGKPSGATFTTAGDMFVKILTFDIDSRWLNMYNKMREFEPRLVEVYGYSERKIYMHHINGETLRNRFNLDAYIEACDIGLNIGKFCKLNNVSFIHHDLALRNFMLEKDTGKVYLIDVDTFNFYNEDGYQFWE